MVIIYCRLRQVKGWPPLAVAAGCRLYKHSAEMLLNGRADPGTMPMHCFPCLPSCKHRAVCMGDGCFDLIKLLCVNLNGHADPGLGDRRNGWNDSNRASKRVDIVAIARSPQPWTGAPPLCRKTITLMKQAVAPWSPSNHWLHHKGIRECVWTLLLIAQVLSYDDVDECADGIHSHAIEDTKGTQAIKHSDEQEATATRTNMGTGTGTDTGAGATDSAGATDGKRRAKSRTKSRTKSRLEPLPPSLPMEMWYRVLTFVQVGRQSQCQSNYYSAPLFGQNGLQAKSGFEMCFDIGSQHLGCWGQNTPPYAQGCDLS